MKRSNYLGLILLVLLLISSLVACGVEGEGEPVPTEDAVAGEPARPAREVIVTEATEPVERTTIEKEVAKPVEPASESDLDAAFSDFLTKMVQYNAIGLDALSQQLTGDPPPFLLDVRQPEEVAANGHIEGAVNVPLRELGQNLSLLPDFDGLIVSYCSNGWRCTIAMTALGGLGWENVLSLKGGGFDAWAEIGYPVVAGPAVEPVVLNVAEPSPGILSLMAEVMKTLPESWGLLTTDQLKADLAENPDLLVIDVRTQGEVQETGVIQAENFAHIPLKELIAQKSAWPADKETPVAIICRSGHRSTVAMTILWFYGYTDVRSLKGGMRDWVESGYPIMEFVPA